MRKRLLTLLLTAAMALSLFSVPAAAATVAFSDVSDRSVAAAAETLRLMGVLDGYGDGTFRPGTELNRAQFCKMVVYAMDGSDELGKYSTVTVFPDVKPSHWASSFINMAAKGARVISGYPDGKFHPERTVTAGQAVTILLRLLGYSDADIGGIWPASQMAMGKSIGLTDGVGLSDGNRALTRAQAAKLFQNFLHTETKSGGTYYELSDEVTLLSLDGGDGTMTVTGSKTYSMAHAKAASSLVGSRGKVVLNDKGEALTFLPVSGNSTGVASGAVVIYADRSAAGLDALTGGNSYTIYKNGTLAAAGDLRKNDVATWNAGNQTVRVCDTRVTVYYENCAPSPDAPTTIEVLGGTAFHVLPTAADSLAKFKPGQVVTLLLTADGQVAGAVEPNSGARSNAVGVVSETGKVRMLCGTMLMDLNVTAEEKYHGQLVRISSSKKDEVNMTTLQGGVSGDLDVAARKLGGKTLAENVMIFREQALVGLTQLPAGTIREKDIAYARTNWAGNVDLIVLKGVTADIIYGRAIVRGQREEDGEGGYTTVTKVSVEYGSGRATEFYDSPGIGDGDFVAAKINSTKNGFSMLRELTRLKNVSESAWVGKGAVNFGGKTYTVPETVLCYNADAKTWITLDAALAYADTMDLHVDDGVVRIISVKS